MRGRSKIGGGASAVVLGTALALLAGCSAYDSLTGSRPAATTPSPPPAASSSSRSFTQRFTDFVSGGGSSDTVPRTATDNPSDTDLDCPSVQIRQGASTFQQSGPDNGSSALSLRFQANFVRFARECAVHGPNVTLKVGIEGRVILGPAGTPGQITLPVRLAVVREGINPQTVWTKFYMVPVDVPTGQENILFTHVEEDMTFPMPPGNQFDQYVIYAGFDPQSAAAEPKKKPAKPVRRPKPRPQASAQPPQ